MNLNYYLLAHAAVYQKLSTGDTKEQSAWSAGQRLSARGNWATYSTFLMSCLCNAGAPTPAPTFPGCIPGCVSAFAYCPGLSQCLIPDYSSIWGWNVDLESLGEEDSLTCPIYANAFNCLIPPEGKGLKVGQLTISSNLVKTEIFPPYTAAEFHTYAGDCPVNDAGYHLDNGECKSEMEKLWSRQVGTYSLSGALVGVNTTGFAVDDTNYTNFLSGTWAQNSYEFFPLGGGSSGKRYLSSHTIVCGLKTKGVILPGSVQ
jgi:hypothetical protein